MSQDPNAGSNKDNKWLSAESTDGLMGGATAMIVCAVCCLCLMFGLFIAFFVWAIITLINSSPSHESDCGRANLMWEFCIIVVVFQPILGICVNFVAMGSQMAWVAALPTLLSLGMAIWGVLIWSQLGECAIYYAQSFPDLFLLFKIEVIIFVLAFSLLCCALMMTVCLLGSALGEVVGGGRKTDGYSSVPEGGGDPASDESLRSAARTGQLGEVDRLLSADVTANVNAADAAGWTALHYAAHRGHRRVAERLVAAGARLEAETQDGKTPLRLAEEQRNDVLPFLRDLGASTFATGGRHQAATMEFV